MCGAALQSRFNVTLAAGLFLAFVLPCVASTASASVYIVEFDGPALAQTGRAPNRRSPMRAGLDLQLDQLAARQDAQLEQIELRIGRSLAPERRYRYVLNALALMLSPGEAAAVADVDGVRGVTLDGELPLARPEAVDDGSATAFADAAVRARTTQGDRTPDPVVQTVGALGVWDGSATGLAPTRGEGIVVGVIGAGINGDHPSFAQSGEDGYTHTNPFGDGIYLGECESQPDLCNAKLVGRYDLTGSGDTDDPEGSTSYALAIAAGNVLLDVELPTSLGSLSGAVVPVVAGVAPHANVVVYDACLGYSCRTTDVISALEQAGLDGIDVLIMLVGTSTSSSFGDPVSLSFLSLRTQGVSSVLGASVSGPGDGSITRSAVAPWTTTFTRTTHSRIAGAKQLADFKGGATPPPDLLGLGLSPGLTAPVVDAAAAGPIPGDVDVRQCNVPFPSGTFAGAIAVCERGPIPFVTRVQNVVDGGAVGMILIDPADPLGLPLPSVPVVSSFPYISLLADDGAALREWLGVGASHSATIGAAQYVDVPEFADQLGPFNARGPSADGNFLAPNAAAPGIAVLAAWSSPRNFRILSGRGSYPGAGAIALLKSLHPDWSDAQLLSALVTTGRRDIVDQATLAPATPFGIGGGRIDVSAAARATLTLHVDDDAFTALIPDGNGLRDLNLPALVDLECLDSCSFTRTVQATRDGTWASLGASDSDGLQVSVTPSQFSLLRGEEQALAITVGAAQSPAGGFRFGAVRLVPTTDEPLPITTIPVAVDLYVDPDGDDVVSRLDNCTLLANADQRDSDGDGYGNRCDPDLNNDGMVNATDVGIIRAAFGGNDANADLDGDGIVGEQDVDIMRDLYFAAPGPSGVAASDSL